MFNETKEFFSIFKRISIIHPDKRDGAIVNCII